MQNEEPRFSSTGELSLSQTHQQLFQMLSESKDSAALAILEPGFEPNICNSYGDTPLIWAVSNGLELSFNRLLELGADPDRAGWKSYTPLHWAARRGRLSMAIRLVEKGANPMGLDQRKRSALHLAIEEGQLEMAEWLLQQKLNPNQVSQDGFVPLHLAIQKGSPELCQMLVLKGADPFFAGSARPSPAKMALDSGQEKLLIQEKIVAKFPDLSQRIFAMVERKTRDQNTPFVLDDKALCQMIHEKVNQVRESKGLTLLTMHEALSEVALSHSQDMAQRHFFSHQNPDGESPGERSLRMKYQPPLEFLQKNRFGLGENIFKGSIIVGTTEERVKDEKIVTTQWHTLDSLARQIFEGWMSSPGHRENILDPKWRLEGLGVALKGDEIYVTQNFY